MTDTVTLRYSRSVVPMKAVYFYDGFLVARDGLLTLPLDHPHWIRRAFVNGYNNAPNGDRLWNMMDVQAEIERQTAESAKEENESFNGGRQPKPTNRVRAGQRQSSASV